MLTANYLETSEKIHKSKLTRVTDTRLLQIGHKYVVVRADTDSHGYCEHDHEPFKETNDYKIIKILSVTPKIDLSKTPSNYTFDLACGDSDISFDDETYNHPEKYTFKKYLENSSISFMSKCQFNSGWIYCEIEYQEEFSREKKIDIAFHKICNGCISFENSKILKSTDKHGHKIYNVENIYMSDLFEYDFSNSKKYGKTLKGEDSTDKAIRKLKSGPLHDHLIYNFKLGLAYCMKNNTQMIKDTETIEIDGKVWYNGFHNFLNGVDGRNHLFYDYIPWGWRLPKFDELMGMLKKHPLLEKKLKPEETLKNERFARRNNVGMECYYGSNFEPSGWGREASLPAVTLEDNDYRKESCYFINRLKCIDLWSNKARYKSSCTYQCNSGCRQYLIMLVKMTDEEIAQQEAWVNQVLNEGYKYSTIEEIYEKYSINDFSKVTGISFDLMYGDEVRKYDKKANNKYLSELKDCIARYMGNNDIKHADKINLSFEGNGFRGTLDFDSETTCDIKEFVTKITPLLNESLCWANVNNIEKLAYDGGYYNDKNIWNILRQYKYYGRIPENMYFYIKDTLSMLGINHGELMSRKKREDEYSHDRGSYYRRYESDYYYFSGTAYISELTFHMNDGTDITVKDLPMECFNMSKLYAGILKNKKNFSKKILDFKKSLNEQIDKKNSGKYFTVEEGFIEEN